MSNRMKALLLIPASLIVSILYATELTIQSEPSGPSITLKPESSQEFYSRALKFQVRTPASELQRELRLEHAQELLGKHYQRSVVRSGKNIKKMNGVVYRYVREHLPKKHRSQYQKVAQAIIDESLKYEFDPIFLLSVISGESSFNPDRRGPLDEIGLMQVRPATGEWIAKKSHIPWKGEKALFDPVYNIKIGAVLLSHLRVEFDSHARLYLAAYNMGARNVREARERKIWPKDYPIHVMRRYVDFYTDLQPKSDSSTKM